MSPTKKIIILVVLIVLVSGILFVANYKNNSDMGSASLSWNSAAESDLVGYKIYYGTNPRTNNCPQGGYVKVIDAGKDTKYVINNLEPGKTYYFSVTSYNSSKKESCFSEEMKKSIPVSRINRIKNFFTGKE